MSRIAVSGMGAVSCVGLGAESLWNNVVNENSGIDSTGLGRISDSTIEELRRTLRLSDKTSRSVVIGLASISEAMRQAGWDKLKPDDGLIVGTTTGQIDLWELELTRFLNKELSPETFGRSLRSQSLGSCTEALSQVHSFTGKKMTITSACSAATQALALAQQWIAQGKVQRCLVGGIEILSRLTVEGFRSLQLLNAKIATPFDKDRQGINLAEGAAFFCLERNPKNPLAYISGYGSTTDAHHMTAPHPEGIGSLEAMTLALKRANLQPSEIDWVHAHGTGSRANDDSEGKALVSLFGKEGSWVSSTKSIHGHTLAASGAIESVLCIQSLSKQMILKTSGLRNSDVPVRHPTEHKSITVNHILKNTLGFGGNNSALVFDHPSVGPRT